MWSKLKAMASPDVRQLQTLDAAKSIWQDMYNAEVARAKGDGNAQNIGISPAEPKPVGRGVFGDIYDQFKGKAKEAFNFLISRKSGDLTGVFHRNEIGDIDLVWGDKNGGLAHIIEKHINDKDFKTQEEMIGVIEDTINNGEIVKSDKYHHEIVKDGYIVSLRKDYDGVKKNWVVTSFKLQNPNSKQPISDTTLSSPNVNQGGRTVAADSAFSAGKVTENVSDAQGNGGGKEKTGTRIEELMSELDKETTKFNSVDFATARKLDLWTLYRRKCYDIGHEIGTIIGDKDKVKTWFDNEIINSGISEIGKTPILNGLFDGVKGVEENRARYNVSLNKEKQDANGMPVSEDEPQPVGRGVFGDIYDQFKGKAKEAVKFLMDKKSGEAVDVLRHKDVDGGISLVWGDDKAGLAHIIGKHPELVENLQEVIDGMSVTSQSDNRIVLESDTHKAVIFKMKGSEHTTNWLLTAYEKKKPVSASSSDIETEPKGKRNGTATPQNGLSAGKGSEVLADKQANAEKYDGTATGLVANEHTGKLAKSAQTMLDEVAKQTGIAIRPSNSATIAAEMGLTLEQAKRILDYITEVWSKLKAMASPDVRQLQALDAAKNIWQDMYNAEVARAKGQASDVGDDVRFSIREKEAPKRAIKAYKLFKVDKDGKPHALFIDSANPLEPRIWYDADSPIIKDLENLDTGVYLIDKNGEYRKWDGEPTKAEVNDATINNSRFIKVGTYKNGKKSYHNYGINGSGGVSTFAMRPGWHATNAPTAHHIGAGKNGALSIYRRPDERWFEIEIAADKDYNEEAQQNPTKDIPTHIPEDGWYKFQTNTNANKAQDWIIGGSMRILRPLTEQQAADIATSLGYERDLPYKDGIKNFDDSPAEDTRYSVLDEDAAMAADRAEGTTERMDNLKVAKEMEAAHNNKKQRIEKLRNSESVKDQYNGQYELNRESAKKWMKNNLRGEYSNTDTGDKVLLSKIGINEVTSHGSTDEAHLKSIASIPQMIEQSVFVEEIPNTKDNAKYDSYRYYVCGLDIDGKPYTAKIVVGVKGDNKYYDHRLTQIEKGSLIDNLNGLSNSVVEDQNASVYGRKDTKLLSILQINDKDFAQRIKLATGWERGKGGGWQYDEGHIGNNDANSSGTRFSVADDVRDAEYAQAVKDGDMEKAQKLLQEAANAKYKKSVIRDENGNLMKVYHGGIRGTDFTVFDKEKIGSSGAGRYEGFGFNFTPSEIRANGYSNGAIIEVYLDAKKPAADNGRKMAFEKFFNIFREVEDANETKITEEYGYYPATQYNMLKAARMIYDYAESNADLNSQMAIPFIGDAKTFLKAWNKAGYDSLIWHDKYSGKISTIVVFNPEQIKSAEPITYDDDGNVIPLSKRFNDGNEDIRFSVSSEEEKERSSGRGRTHSQTATSPEDLNQTGTVRLSRNAVAQSDLIAKLRNNFYTAKKKLKSFAKDGYKLTSMAKDVQNLVRRLANSIGLRQESPNTNSFYSDFAIETANGKFRLSNHPANGDLMSRGDFDQRISVFIYDKKGEHKNDGKKPWREFVFYPDTMSKEEIAKIEAENKGIKVNTASQDEITKSVALMLDDMLEGRTAQDRSRKAIERGYNSEAEMIENLASGNTTPSGTRFSVADEARDAEYAQAVKDGDMEKAQKMVDEAAKNWGAIANEDGNPLRMYHGTKLLEYYFKDGRPYVSPIQKFTVFKSGFFTPSRHAALSFANGVKHKVYDCYVKMNNPLVVDAKGAEYDNITLDDGTVTTTDRIVNETKYRGLYDGVIIKNVSGENNTRQTGVIDDYIPFVSSNIKLADTITYDNNGNLIPLSERFNETQSDIRFSLGDPADTFEERQRRAVENKGTVMPGLNDAEVKIVDVPKHPYKGTLGRKAAGHC